MKNLHSSAMIVGIAIIFTAGCNDGACDTFEPHREKDVETNSKNAAIRAEFANADNDAEVWIAELDASAIEAQRIIFTGLKAAGIPIVDWPSGVVMSITVYKKDALQAIDILQKSVPLKQYHVKVYPDPIVRKRAVKKDNGK